MKKLKLIALLGILFFASSTINAQVSVNVNLGTPPSWGPSGYAAVDYYYLPDIEAYYDIRATQFIYFGGGQWIRSRNLPNQYRNYNLYNGYKVAAPCTVTLSPIAKCSFFCVERSISASSALRG